MPIPERNEMKSQTYQEGTQMAMACCLKIQSASQVCWFRVITFRESEVLSSHTRFQIGFPYVVHLPACGIIIRDQQVDNKVERKTLVDKAKI